MKCVDGWADMLVESIVDLFIIIIIFWGGVHFLPFTPYQALKDKPLPSPTDMKWEDVKWIMVGGIPKPSTLHISASAQQQMQTSLLPNLEVFGSKFNNANPSCPLAVSIRHITKSLYNFYGHPQMVASAHERLYHKLPPLQ